jgi:hypothetical protein
MIPRELIEGVKKMLELGAAREIVHTFLLEKGWSESDAREVFSLIDAESARGAELKVEKEERMPSGNVTASTPSVPQVVSHPPAAHRPESSSKDTSVEKVLDTKVITIEEGEEKKVASQQPTIAPTKKQIPTIPLQKQKTEEKPAPEVQTQKKIEQAPQKVALTKKPTLNVERPKPVNTQGEVTKKADESSVQQRRRPELRKVSPPPTESEVQETELFEVSNLSSPLTLVSVAIASAKQQFWNLFFLSFMVSIFTLVLYIILSYILTAERLNNLWITIVSGDSSIFFITPLLVLGLMAAGAFIFTVLLWLPSAYILAFSGRKSSFRDLFFGGFTGAFSLFVSSVFVLLFIISGSVLLLIPGIMFAVWFAFAPLISVAERTSPFAALLISRELVKNHFWDVLWREVFLLVPASIFALLFMLLLSPLALLDTFGLGTGLIVALFVTFAAFLFVFGILLFFFAYHVALYKEMRARTQTVKLSRGLARALPLLLIIPLIGSLAVAFYVSSLA